MEFQKSDACPLNLVPQFPMLLPERRTIDWRRKQINSCVRKEALGLSLMSTVTMIRCYIIGNMQMCPKAFYFSKVGLGYIGNSALVYRKKSDTNLQSWLSLGIMHFIIQSALLGYSFPSLILVCHIRLV